MAILFQDLENDESYTVGDMILYDGQPILMDTMFFFVLGRLYEKRGVDHPAWLMVAFFGGLLKSLETKVPLLQASVTLYNMYCRWPWQLWAFAIVMVVLIAVVIFYHVRYAIRQNIWVMKMIEMTFCVCLFLVPPLSSPYFHFHHWFASWLLGMHLNFDVWWSRLCMAYCWGDYVNGIAVYGRDPLLTCGYAFYLSATGRCPYLQCYIDALQDTNHTHSDYQPMEAQDWWNCSAENYLP